jgi:four helix bundle protein
MDNAHGFEELVAWQRVHELRNQIYEATPDGIAGGDTVLRQEIRNAAHTAERHIVDGFGRFNPLVFANFLEFSRTAACEIRSLLQKGARCGYFSADHVRRLDHLTVRALQAIVSFRRYLRSPAAKRNTTRRYPRPYTAARMNDAGVAHTFDSGPRVE